MANTELSLRDAHNKFLAHLKEKSRAAATILAYGKDIEQLIQFLEKKGNSTKVISVSQGEIEKFLQEMGKNGYTQKSISRKINSIKTFFRYLKISEFLVEDPAVFITHPKYEVKPPRILSKQEYRSLRDACREDARISAIVEILLQTGIRIGELAALELTDIKESVLFIKPMEKHPAREVPLNKAAKQALERYLAVRPKVTEKILFITKTGKPLLIRNIRTAIDRYFKIADIKNAKVNDLRHTFIAYHLKEGTSLVLVSKLVGHRRLSTTEKYLDLVKDQMEEKVKLGEL